MTCMCWLCDGDTISHKDYLECKSCGAEKKAFTRFVRYWTPATGQREVRVHTFVPYGCIFVFISMEFKELLSVLIVLFLKLLLAVILYR